MLARAGLHGDKNKLARRVKMELNMIPEDTNTNEKEAMQAISNYEFSEEQYHILCIPWRWVVTLGVKTSIPSGQHRAVRKHTSPRR